VRYSFGFLCKNHQPTKQDWYQVTGNIKNRKEKTSTNGHIILADCFDKCNYSNTGFDCKLIILLKNDKFIELHGNIVMFDTSQKRSLSRRRGGRYIKKIFILSVISHKNQSCQPLFFFEQEYAEK